MATCETCGNEYGRALEVRINGQSHVFDCFECAIARLAPRCKNCGISVIGHGLEAGDQIYCCAHCARTQGVSGLRDHA